MADIIVVDGSAVGIREGVNALGAFMGRSNSYGVAVCARQFKPVAFSNLTNVTFQRFYRISKRTAQIRLVYVNMAPAGAPNESSAGSYTITSASAIFGWTGSGTGLSIPVTFNGGSASVNVAAYQTVTSDPITLPWFVAEGDLINIRNYITASGAFIPTENGSAGGVYSEGYIASDLVSSGNTGNSFSGATQTLGFGPTMVVANTGAGVVGIYGAGDSIMAGTGWVFARPSGYFAPGFLGDWAIQNNVPIYNASRSGELLSTAVGRFPYAGSIQRQSLAPYFRNFLSNYGTNDLATRTVAQMKADYLAYWAGMAAAGMRVFQQTLLPKTTSSDQWQTAANQTVTSDEANRLAINQWLRAPVSAGAGNSAMFDAGGALYAVIDTALTNEINADGSAITINPATGAISNGTGGRWFVDATAYDTGTTTSWTNAQRPNDTAKSWTVNQWWGYTMLITADAGTPAAVGQAQDIATNTTTQLTTNTFSTLPSATSSYKIYRRPTIDGVHPSTWVHERMSGVLDAAKMAGLFQT